MYLQQYYFLSNKDNLVIAAEEGAFEVPIPANSRAFTRPWGLLDDKH